MNLESILGGTIKPFRGVGRRKVRLGKQNLVERVRDSLGTASYNVGEAVDKVRVYGQNNRAVGKAMKYASFIPKALKTTGQLILESRIVGALPEWIADKYSRRFNIRPKNRPTLSSVVYGVVENAAQLALGYASIASGVPFLGTGFGWFNITQAWYGFAETAFRLGYTLKTKRNIGIASYALADRGIRLASKAFRNGKDNLSWTPQWKPIGAQYMPAGSYR